MDSLSQIVLGAAVGEVMLGKKIGNRAQLIGAIGGTIPDLDIFLNPFFTDEITKLQIHRGYSHSMFVHLLLALPFAWLCYKLIRERKPKIKGQSLDEEYTLPSPSPKITFRYWYLTWYLFFLTHTLLDCCTTYGTQLLLPFTNYLIGFNNIAVVDPFWTLPFMFMLIVCLFIKRHNPKRIKWAWAAIAYSMLYMVFTLVNKYTVHNQFKDELARQNIQVENLYTSPSMFNNILWSGIATTQDSIYVGEYSLMQHRDEVKWTSFPRHLEVLAAHPSQREIKVLEWFGQGKHFVKEVNGELHIFLAKWGRADWTKTEIHDQFVFYWKIVNQNGTWVAMPVEPNFGKEEFSEAWNALWRRVKTADNY
ncbi:MAG: metal-dependent hydrolase [Flavobacteriales bacterium]